MTNPTRNPLAHLRILTMKDVSEITTYQPAYIYRLLRQGRFVPLIRIGPNRVGFRQADIEKWLAERPLVRPANDNPSDDD